MSEFTAILSNWHFWVMVVVYWLVSNAISALPMPDQTSTKFYSWLFKFANGFAANMSRAATGKIPGVGTGGV